jgi:hypothetical protein
MQAEKIALVIRTVEFRRSETFFRFFIRRERWLLRLQEFQNRLFLGNEAQMTEY